MNKKVLIGAVVVLLIGWLLVGFGSKEAPVATSTQNEDNSGTETSERMEGEEINGSYTVRGNESQVLWSGKKPLIDGYINTGSIGVTNGQFTVTDEGVTGSFTIDMTTLSVSETKAKPGRESSLESHLKGEGWFNVEEYPTAEFTITQVTDGTGEEYTDTITGNLTMKGVTNPVTFPANVWVDSSGILHAEGSFEIDRTLWNITAGSASFFDSLADNAVSDQVAISFAVLANPQ